MYDALKERIGFDMKPFRKYIDNEMLVTIAQMDKPSKIFDYLYLVSELSFLTQQSAIELEISQVLQLLNRQVCCHLTATSSS